MFPKLALHDLANKRKSRVVAELIIEALRDGRFKPAEKLPAERLLADQLGVSRGVVREALSALQLASIIQIRTGEGSYVTEHPILEDGAAQAFTLLEQNESPLELWEARRELEITLVRLAAGMADAAHHATVEARLREMCELAEAGDIPAYLAANATFHRTLIQPVENSILRQFASQLIEATNQLLTRDTVQRYVETYLTASVQKHVDIFHAYVSGDPEAIRKAITHHFDELTAYYLRG